MNSNNMPRRRPADHFAPTLIVNYCLIFLALSIGTTIPNSPFVVAAFTSGSSSMLLQTKSSPFFTHHLPSRNIKPITSLHLSNNDDEENDPRDNFGRAVRGVQSSALKTSVEVGDTVVCKLSVPDLSIYENASYEVSSIYSQYFDDQTQQIVKEPLSCLGDDIIITAGTRRNNSKVYMTLFSPQYHSAPVIVTPEEVGLVSVREELFNAAWLAVPGFFWVFLAFSFYNTYHERTGGSLGDALLGR